MTNREKRRNGSSSREKGTQRPVEGFVVIYPLPEAATGMTAAPRLVRVSDVAFGIDHEMARKRGGRFEPGGAGAAERHGPAKREDRRSELEEDDDLLEDERWVGDELESADTGEDDDLDHADDEDRDYGEEDEEEDDDEVDER
jgi:hypothetical protein